jgi:hypothetical protein
VSEKGIATIDGSGGHPHSITDHPVADFEPHPPLDFADLRQRATELRRRGSHGYPNQQRDPGCPQAGVDSPDFPVIRHLLAVRRDGSVDGISQIFEERFQLDCLDGIVESNNVVHYK